MHRPPKWPGHLKRFRQTPTLNGNAHRSRPPFGVHGSWVGRGERARLMQVCGVLRLVYRGTRTELSVYQLVTDLSPSTGTVTDLVQANRWALLGRGVLDSRVPGDARFGLVAGQRRTR